MKIIFSSIIVLIIGYLSFLAWLYLNQRNLLYHPHKENHQLSYYKLENTEEITLITRDGVKLQAWYNQPDKDKPMTIFLHGNAGNLEDRTDKLQQLIKMGYGFIIPTWRGFGKSEGKPTMNGLMLDAEAAVEFVRSKGYKLDQTIIIGESLGTGVATEMATRYHFKGLFLITPYTSIAARAAEIYPIILSEDLVKDNFNVIDKVVYIGQPLLIIHGADDEVIPYSHSEAIFAKAKEPKKLVLYPHVGHNNYDIAESFSQMESFFNR